MNLDTDRIDQAMLALLYLGLHESSRAWKSFDRDAMAWLHQQGFISNPTGKAKSVTFTEEGLRGSKCFLQALFGSKSWVSTLSRRCTRSQPLLERSIDSGLPDFACRLECFQHFR